MNLPPPVLDAVNRGWSVIPIGPDKKPLIPWRDRQETPATDNEVASWQETLKPIAWGVVTGRVSGIIVLDFDGDAGRALLERLGLEPHVRTGSGGFHSYIQHPGWLVPTLNGKSKKTLGQKFPGLDIRADGGYAVFHGQNAYGEYLALRDPTPDSPNILPTELRQALGLYQPPVDDAAPSVPTDPAPSTPQASRGNVPGDVLLAEALDLVNQGQGRNNAGFWLGCQLRDNGHPESNAAAFMRKFVTSVGPQNTKGLVEIYSEKDALASLEQAYSRPARDPWRPRSAVCPDLTILEGLADRAANSSTALDDDAVIRALAWLSVHQPGKYDDVQRKLRKADIGRQVYEPRVREAARKFRMASFDQELATISQGEEQEEKYGPFAAWRSPDGCYEIVRAKTFLTSHDRKGDVNRDLVANFVARVVEEIALDDGVEVNRFFVLDGMLYTGQPLPAIRVPVAKFNAMSWHTEHWGFGPTIFAGLNLKDHLRVAISEFSGVGIPRQTVYVHLGWRRLPSRGWVFVHAGGAIGADDISVDLETELQKYTLPRERGDVLESMRLSLSFLELGDPRITFPLWATAWRAPLCEWLPFLMMPWLLGESGTLKSTLAALLISHFGGPFNKDTLPGSWLDTENRLEQRAFFAKDCPLVVDDYFPERHSGFVQELERRASRLIRGVGNRQARGRLRADLSARKSFFPRGLVISTAEQIPNLAISALARILPVPFAKGSIDKEKLTALQAKASLLPHALRSYIEHLAPMGDTLGDELRKRFEDLRGRARVEGHDRLPEAVAHLFIGFEMGIGFALKVGAINEAEGKVILSRAWTVLVEIVRDHGKLLHEERPSRLFIQTIQEALATGKAYLGHRSTGDSAIGGPDGEKIGWIDPNGVYLLPTVAIGLVTKLLQHRGGLSLTDRALKEMLLKDGLLQKRDPDRLTVRLRFEQKPVWVICLQPNVLEDSGVTGTAGSTAPEDSPEALSERGPGGPQSEKKE